MESNGESCGTFGDKDGWSKYNVSRGTGPGTQVGRQIVDKEINSQ